MATEADIIQNLKDAGCDEKIIDSFMHCYKCGDVRNGLRTLNRHRKDLLDELHGEQRRIDCLDYLIFELNRAETEK